MAISILAVFLTGLALIVGGLYLCAARRRAVWRSRMKDLTPAEAKKLIPVAKLIKRVSEAFYALGEEGCAMEVRDARMNALFVEANRGCELCRALAHTVMAQLGIPTFFRSRPESIRSSDSTHWPPSVKRTSSSLRKKGKGGARTRVTRTCLSRLEFLGSKEAKGSGKTTALYSGLLQAFVRPRGEYSRSKRTRTCDCRNEGLGGSDGADGDRN